MIEFAGRLADLSPQAKRTLLTQLLRQKVGNSLAYIDRFGVNVKDLRHDAMLDESIRPDTARPASADEPAHVLLTGATGFLGAFLLHELLEQSRATVHCLVRAESVEAASERLRHTLESYYLWDDSFASRIVPVVGDLATPQLGLSSEARETLASEIDVIYHSGAFVNWIFPYERLKPANVQGTEEILRLASTVRLKPVHFISSLGVFPLVGQIGVDVVRESDPLDHGGVLYGGYLQSKWVAESLVQVARARGIPVCVYRPGLITGHSETGAWNTRDVTSRMIKSWIELESMPELQFDTSDMTPVDYISRAVIHLSLRNDSLGQTFHLANPRPVRLGKLANWIRSLGYPLRQIPYDVWMAAVLSRNGPSQEDVVSSLVPLFSLTISGNAPNMLRKLPEFDCTNTLAGLAGSGILCRPVDDRVLQNYFSHFFRRGFLRPPPSNGRAPRQDGPGR